MKKISLLVLLFLPLLMFAKTKDPVHIRQVKSDYKDNAIVAYLEVNMSATDLKYAKFDLFCSNKKRGRVSFVKINWGTKSGKPSPGKNKVYMVLKKGALKKGEKATLNLTVNIKKKTFKTKSREFKFAPESNRILNTNRSNNNSSNSSEPDNNELAEEREHVFLDQSGEVELTVKSIRKALFGTITSFQFPIILKNMTSERKNVSFRRIEMILTSTIELPGHLFYDNSRSGQLTLEPEQEIEATIVVIPVRDALREILALEHIRNISLFFNNISISIPVEQLNYSELSSDPFAPAENVDTIAFSDGRLQVTVLELQKATLANQKLIRAVLRVDNLTSQEKRVVFDASRLNLTGDRGLLIGRYIFDGYEPEIITGTISYPDGRKLTIVERVTFNIAPYTSVSGSLDCLQNILFNIDIDALTERDIEYLRFGVNSHTIEIPAENLIITGF